jgi:2-polyprenyl-3-methyl-5-hydroxy-6-metoxy-1,4-benzoquinol methylase
MMHAREHEHLIAMQRRYWNGLADRYQRGMRIATDDFHYGPQIPGENALKLLPPFRAGQTALELGCGAAQNSIWLARQGVACTAADLSAEQLRHARANARAAGVRIRFLRLPIEQLSRRIPEAFDFVHSSHALEFVENPGRCVAQMAERLRPGGTLMISTVHPLFNGEWVEQLDADGQPAGMGIFLSNYFTPPDDTRRHGRRVEVISRAYPVSAWFNWLRVAGLEGVRLEEPAAATGDIEPPYTSRAWARHEGELNAIPGTLILVARQKRDRSA